MGIFTESCKVMSFCQNSEAPSICQQFLFLYQWLGNVDMHLYANMPCCSRVFYWYICNGRTDSHIDYSADPMVAQ